MSEQPEYAGTDPDDWPSLMDVVGTDGAGNLLRLRVTAPGGVTLNLQVAADLLKAARLTHYSIVTEDDGTTET